MKPATILKAGEPLLQTPAQAITQFSSKALNELVEYLFFNLKHFNGAGLAAPQIGESKRIVVYGFEKNPRYPDAKPVPLTVLINPEITTFSAEKVEGYEGCLSIPHIRGLVPRAHSIHCKSYTLEGKLVEKTMTGFEARIIQHEVDHLNGVLYPMRMMDMSTLKYTEN